MLSIIILSPFKKIIELILENPYIFKLQQFFQDEQENGKDIDTILDETNIFDEFEEILPDDEFPIFVISILNGFKSDVVVNKLLDVIDECKDG